MKSNTDRNGIWAPRPFAPGDALRFTLPPLALFLARSRDEYRVAVVDAPDASANALATNAEAPENPAWRRFMAPSDMDRVCVRPVLPDRPLVVRPADTVGLVPGHRTTLFVGLPVWFRVEASTQTGQPVTLMEAPSLPLSKSWFGMPESGEPCYALKTRARHALEDLTDTMNRAVCYLQLHNRSSGMMTFERFCLRVPNVSLYAAPDGRLWCSDVRADFQGVDAPALIRHLDATAQHAPEAVILSNPRTPPVAHLRDRAFSHFKNLRG